MGRQWPALALLVGIVCGWVAVDTSAGPLPSPSPSARKAESQGQPNACEADDNESVGLVASAIDRHIAARWTEENVQPAAPADDAEFLRRTYLNIVGRIPTASEAQQFLEENGAGKRRRLVDGLLASAAYPTHLADMLRSAIVPEANADQFLLQQSQRFERWLRTRLAENVGYDRIVTELLTGGPRDADSGFYYVAKGNKPENLAAGVSRVFLGVRIECAQCHNHPFAKWRREQFWQLAAFFAGVQPEPGAVVADRELAELPIPGTEKKVSARFLDGEDPAVETRLDSIRGSSSPTGSLLAATPTSLVPRPIASGRNSWAPDWSIPLMISTNRIPLAIPKFSISWRMSSLVTSTT